MKVRTKSKKVDKAWLREHVTDPYVRLAQREGYRSRAAYKLKEIDEQFQLLRPGQLVVDLGAAPGAWCQYIRRRLAGGRRPGAAVAGGRADRIIALDLLEFEPVEDVLFIQGDFRDQAVLGRLEAALGGRPVDVVLSDMAPNLSGIASADAARMAHLVELALDFARLHLAPDGALLAKVFHGSGYSQLVEAFKKTFRVVKPVKPKASRARSAETFLMGQGLKMRVKP